MKSTKEEKGNQEVPQNHSAGSERLLCPGGGQMLVKLP
jgi:hypothetical protein